MQPRLYDIPGYSHACRTTLQDNGLQKRKRSQVFCSLAEIKMKPATSIA